ncbi:MAG: hypothetical protein NTU45_06290 [Planctomycetota bacterium]|jgi:hypothetical protein|nr:hypothetical protein [Planctomycetota bacterium]
MPASRSRTTEWRRSLEQLRDRGGAIEIAVAHDDGGEMLAGGPGNITDLVWRVRVLDVGPNDFSVDLPFALGCPVELPAGTELIGAIAIGQNRWMFRTTVNGSWSPTGPFPKNHRGIRLSLPAQVERCLRRVTRVSVAEIRLPKIELWPLLDAKSVMLAQKASQVAFEAHLKGEDPAPTDDELLPTVGPGFKSTLVNLGGGGLGVLVEPGDSAAFARHRLFWVRFTLGDITPVPIQAAVRVVHTHIDSAHRVYAGISFSFDFNPSYQRVVSDQIIKAIGWLTEHQKKTGGPGLKAA